MGLYDRGRVIDAMGLGNKAGRYAVLYVARWRYMHDLRSLTLEDAIARHSGEATHVSKRFRDLSPVGEATAVHLPQFAVVGASE